MSEIIVIFYQFEAPIWRAIEKQKGVLTFKLCHCKKDYVIP